MKQLFWVLLLVSAFGSAQTCSNSNFASFLADVTLQDTAGHSSGRHGVATGAGTLIPGVPSSNTNIQAACNYTSVGNANCNVSASVNFVGNTTTVEQGTLNPAGNHDVNLGWASGSAGGVGSATATGQFGGGACYTAIGNCSVGVSFPLGVITVSVSGGQKIWSGQTSIPFTCPAVVDPSQQSGGGGGGGGDPCLGSGGGGFQPGSGNTPDPECSPIIIDTEGEGFHLTSAAAGVLFDIAGTGRPVQIAWTNSQFHNGFLALPGPDGLVHSGKELFGNFTPQPPSANPNGFLALLEYDKPENGGNGDGVIDEKDAVFSRLRLWIDENHDGVSQPDELHKLSDLGVYSLALDYFKSSHTDEFGNQFRYKARVNPGERRDSRDETSSGEPSRWTYDVFLVVK